MNNCALSDKDGTTKIFINKQDTAGSTIIYRRAKMDKLKLTKEIHTITLDTYVKKHKPPSIIKLDIEDAEELFIKGGLKNN